MFVECGCAALAIVAHIGDILPEFLLIVVQLLYLVGLALVLVLELVDDGLLLQDLGPELLDLSLVEFLQLVLFVLQFLDLVDLFVDDCLQAFHLLARGVFQRSVVLFGLLVLLDQALDLPL